MKATLKYLRAKRLIHLIDRRLDELERRVFIMKARQLRLV